MAHDPILVENAAAWLRKAGQDLRRVEWRLADESPPWEASAKGSTTHWIC
jgi:hypothetical protein